LTLIDRRTARVDGCLGDGRSRVSVGLPATAPPVHVDQELTDGSLMLGTSFQRMAALDVETLCVGHGEPIASGAGDRIRRVGATLTA
jgi:hypothetical protein